MLSRIAIYFFIEVHGNIECTITGARCYSSDSPQGDALYTALFMVIQKLGRSYTLSVSKILISISINRINLTWTLSTISLSNLILRQIFSLYSIWHCLQQHTYQLKELYIMPKCVLTSLLRNLYSLNFSLLLFTNFKQMLLPTSEIHDWT